MRSSGDRRVSRSRICAPLLGIFVAVTAIVTGCGGGQEISDDLTDSPALTAAEEQLEPDSRVAIATAD